MPKKIQMIGRRFWRLTVISEHKKDNDPNIYYICRCDCGSISKPINGMSLRRGETKSCGCYAREKAIEKLPLAHDGARKHGFGGTRIYQTFQDMKQRCFNPHNKFFKDYGGRGITVCTEWKDDFPAFLNHVSALPHFNEKGYSIDRINNDGNYEPGNVRWATAHEQMMNRRNSTRTMV